MATKQPSTKTAAKYTAANIKTLVFPESVRMNASQYIGGTDSYGLWMIIKELLDNGLDEALAGRNDKVQLFLDKDKSFWVLDAGHGIPQGVTKTKIHVNGKDIVNKMPTMQAVFGALNTSGKYDNTAYEVSIGTHGIGAKGTNATSEFFTAWTYFEGQWYTIAFKKGKLITPPTKCRPPKGPDGKVVKSGTLIHCAPDMSIFSSDKFPINSALEWAEIMSYFNPGVEIKIKSHKSERTYLSKTGVAEYIEKRLAKLGVGAERTFFVYKAEHGDPNAADVMVAFSEHTECDLRGYTNGSYNSKGGKHVDSVTGALYAGLKPFIKTKKVKEDGKTKIVPAFRESDLKEGLVGIVNAKLHKAKFNSQDKVYLSDERVDKPLEAKLEKAALAFFKNNKALAIRICDRATKISELKTKFTLNKKAAASLNAVKRNGLPAKYAGFDLKTKVQDRELFLVEGDSAAGSLKEARFPYQAILPLKGKILNALKDAKGKTFESDEIINILAAIGYDTKAADPYSKLSIGKIICLADPDPDGPFVENTLIRFRTEEGTETELAIADLATLSQQGIKFEVPVWINGREEWRTTTAELVRNVETLVSLQIGGQKYKVSEDHKFVCVYKKSMYGRPFEPFGKGDQELVYVRAADLKIGDRIYCPKFSLSEVKERNNPNRDKETGLGFLPVAKMRIQKLSEPVPVYCLTVPKFHHFVLPSGIVSSNCHINSLLLTLFYKYLPDLFKQGMVYVSAAPEFYAIHKGQLVYADTLSAVQKKLQKIGAPASTPINHLKGWGEAGKNLMKVFAADPTTRRLIRIQAVERDDHVDFVKLMNDDVEYRRNMLGLPSNAKSEEGQKAPAKKAAVKSTKKVPVKKAKVDEDEGEVDEVAERRRRKANTHVRGDAALKRKAA